MITKTRILSLGVALLPWLAMLASADLEVTKWGGDNDYDRDHVGVVPPVDIKTSDCCRMHDLFDFYMIFIIFVI